MSNKFQTLVFWGEKQRVPPPETKSWAIPFPSAEAYKPVAEGGGGLGGPWPPMGNIFVWR